MSLLVQCPNCAGKLNVKDELIDKKVRCPKCKTVFPATNKPRPAPAAPPAITEVEEDPVPIAPRAKKAATPVEEVAFAIRSVSTKHPNGYAYRVTATERAIDFTCLTVDDKGKAPSEEESEKYDFQLSWDEIAEVRKASTMLDPLVVFVHKDGQKTKCTFAESGQEEEAFHALKKAFATLPDVEFIYEQTPMWKRLAPPIAFTVGMVVVGIIAYFALAHMEESTGSVRMNVIVIFIYKTLGKVGVLAVFLAAAAGGLLWTIMKWRKYAAPAPADEEE